MRLFGTTRLLPEAVMGVGLMISGQDVSVGTAGV
jgi:hypothetical protein